MGVDLHTFQQHTEVRWLSIDPAISRIVESGVLYASLSEIWERMRKQHLRVSTTNGWQQCLQKAKRMQLKFCLNFLKSTFPLLEEFLTLFQKSTPTIHLVYDSMYLVTLLIVMRRFLKPTALERKYGATLGSVSCEDVKLQLTDNELVIGDQTRKALVCLNPEKQRLATLGIRAQYPTFSHGYP